MPRLIHWWASNHVAANLLMIVIFFAGVLGFKSLEREMFPTFPYPGMQISVIWPGASPQEVEEQIVDRVEEACLLYTSPSPRDATLSRMPSSA